MTARAPDDRTSDVRGLLAELGELVGDLGLDEPVGSARPAEQAPPRRGKARRRKAEAPEAAAEDSAAEPAPIERERDPELAELAELAAAFATPPPEHPSDLVPLWESSTEEDAHEPELVPLWDAFAPELDAEPPRAWSLSAAMQTVEPAAPPQAPADPSRPVLLRLVQSFRPRIFTITTVAAVLVALAVVVFTRLDLGHTSGPVTPVSKAAFQVTLMRTVDATSAATVAQAQTISHFPARTTQVYMDVAYRNATQGDTLRLVIDLLPPSGSGGNPVEVGDQTHQLPTGGEIAVTIQGPPTGFSAGDYRVTSFHDGHLEQSLSFSVDATPAPSASPTP